MPALYRRNFGEATRHCGCEECILPLRFLRPPIHLSFSAVNQETPPDKPLQWRAAEDSPTSLPNASHWCTRQTLFLNRRSTQMDADLIAARNTESAELDRKSTRLNSSHPSISYAVFCL